MKHRAALFAIPAVAVLAAPAAADLSAEDVWTDWQTNLSAMGQVVTADAAPNGSGLTLRNFRTEQVLQGATTTQALDEIRLIENTDGSVTIELSEPYRLTTEIVEGGRVLGTMAYEARFEGLDAIATGDSNSLHYTYSADRVTVTQAAAALNDPSMPVTQLELVIDGVDALYGLDTLGDDRLLTSTFDFDALVMAMDMTVPDAGGGRMKMSFEVGPATSSGTGDMSAFQSYMQSLAGGRAPTLPDGAEIGGSVTYGSLDYGIQFAGPGVAFQMDGSNDGGIARFGYDASGLTYDLSAEAPEMALVSSQLPVPVNMQMDRSSFELQMPLTPAPEPSEFALGLGLHGLTLNDAAWNQLDPTGALPRDPATLEVDLTGTAQLFVNLAALDPTTMTGPPGELRSLDLNSLVLRLAGAELTGDGAVTFAPGQAQPMPVGQLDLAMDGFYGLLDQLTAANLLPLEFGLAARGMAAVYTRSGAGADQIETTIEFHPSGSITANGIPVPAQ